MTVLKTSPGNIYLRQFHQGKKFESLKPSQFEICNVKKVKLFKFYKIKYSIINIKISFNIGL